MRTLSAGSKPGREAEGSVLVRMSALRNYPVISGNRQIGLLQSVSLDAAQKRVCALIVSCGMRGKRIVLPQSVQSIADGFILAQRVEKYKRAYETAPSLFVRDTTGLLAGRIIDYAIDEESLGIQAIEVMPGYWPCEQRIRIWVYAYTRPDECAGELIVPASLGSELNFSKEGL